MYSQRLAEANRRWHTGNMKNVKRALVTGATNGIGLEITRKLATAGVAVVMVGRDDERLIRARDNIRREAPAVDLTLERSDFAELSQVRALTERLLAGPRLDIIISNAATVAPVDRLTAEGLPRTLVVNHLAPYLLLRGLLPALNSARVVVVGADPVFLAPTPVDLDDLQFRHLDRITPDVELQPFVAYGLTKNMNAMFAYELARRCADRSVTVNAAHPGIIGGTGLVHEAPGVSEAIAKRYNVDFANLPGVDVGADTPFWLASSSEVEGTTGRFFVNRQEVKTAPHTTDRERCERLWRQSAQLVGLPA